MRFRLLSLIVFCFILCTVNGKKQKQQRQPPTKATRSANSNNRAQSNNKEGGSDQNSVYDNVDTTIGGIIANSQGCSTKAGCHNG